MIIKLKKIDNIFKVERAYLILYGGKVFNFFNELKNKSKFVKDGLCDFNFVNMSGKLFYAEGHAGLIILTSEQISFKVKKGRVVVDGENLVLVELTSNTLMIEGKIVKTEMFL